MEPTMLDMTMVVIAIALFVIAILYALGCERL